jgi:hypothetical protein
MVVCDLVSAPAATAGRLFVVSGKPPFDDHGTRVFFSGQGPGSRAPELRDAPLNGLLAAHSRPLKPCTVRLRWTAAKGRPAFNFRRSIR